MGKLTTIEGVGPVIANQLKGAGIGSTDTLLKAGATSAGRRVLAQKARLDEGRVLKFVNHADLMRVKGVGGEYAELLEVSGVDSVPELANRNAEILARRMADENKRRKLVRAVPSAKVVTKWVSQAQRMTRVVTH